VIVLAFNDAGAFVKHKHFDLGDAINTWKFRTGDCVVAGISASSAGQGTKPDKAGYRQRHIVFDAAWQPDSRIVGKLATALDRSQILRLRAAAIREAAGTDVGLIWQDTPDYQQWSDGLPAGPVTLADLATIDMLPEYVMVGEMTGSQLVRLRPAASTIVRGKADPWQRADETLRIEQIEPAKVYRVAMGYWGIPAYRAEPKRLPKLFRFGSESEFVANENIGVFVQGLQQTPIEMTEAVARYIRKRGTITTQPAPASQPG
jgi:hypothetical protein